MNSLQTLIIFLGVTFLGGGLVVLLSFLYDKKSQLKRPEFFLGRYALLTIFPLISTAIITITGGIHVLYIFLLSAILGSIMEFFVGFMINTAVGSPLWIYKHGRISDYTSFLIVPWWGFAGVFFWLIASVVTQSGF